MRCGILALRSEKIHSCYGQAVQGVPVPSSAVGGCKFIQSSNSDVWLKNTIGGILRLSLEKVMYGVVRIYRHCLMQCGKITILTLGNGNIYILHGQPHTINTRSSNSRSAFVDI